MSEQEQETVETPDVQVEAGAPPVEEAQPSPEEVARERGWKPRDEWKGEVPDSFVDDPDEYNEMFEKSLPKLKREVETLRGQLDEFNGFKQRHEKLYARQMEDELAKIRTELQGAYKAGDANRAEDLLSRRDEIRDEMSGKQTSSGLQAEIGDWLSQNPEYDSSSSSADLKKATAAEIVGQRLSQENPNLRGKAFLDEVKARVDAELGDSPKKAAPKVEGVRRAGRSGSPRKVTEWSQMPADKQNDPNVARIVARMYGGDKDKYAQDWAKMNQEN